jgi:Ca2+-binding RTX toxin-like protein
LAGGADNDFIQADAGTNWPGDDGNDEICGGTGHADQLKAGSRRSFMARRATTLFGQKAMISPSGGPAQPFRLGGAGNDTYVIDPDVGDDIVIDNEGTNYAAVRRRHTTDQLSCQGR